MRRPRTPLKLELPLISFLGVVWMTLWQDFTIGTFLIGVLYGGLIVRVFYLPPLRGTGRVNLWWGFVYGIRFLGKMVAASFQVAWTIVAKGPKLENRVVSVQLRSHDDFVVTMVGHTLALVPGSLVLDVDRTTATLYLHCLDVTSDQAAETIRQDALTTEALFLRACGNRSDLAVVKAEDRLGRTSGLTTEELARPFTAEGLTVSATKPQASVAEEAS